MSDVLKQLQTNMSAELEMVTNEIGNVQKALENLAIRQQQLKGACYALQLAQGELTKAASTDKAANEREAVETAKEAAPAVATLEVAPESRSPQDTVGGSDGSPQST